MGIINLLKTVSGDGLLNTDKTLENALAQAKAF